MPDKQVTALREAKKEECRRAILHAARDCFEAKGYYNATTNEIASAANISPASLFNYFPNKLCLIAEIENMKVHDFSKILQRQSDGADGCLRNLVLIFDSYMEDLFLYPRLSFQISEFHAFGVFPDKMNSEMRDTVFDLIDRAIHKGEFSCQADRELVGSVFFSLGFLAIIKGLEKEDCLRLFRQFLSHYAADPRSLDG